MLFRADSGEWEPKRGEEMRKERSLRSEKEGLSLRCEGGAGLNDDGVLGPKVGELLQFTTTRQHVSEEGERGGGEWLYNCSSLLKERQWVEQASWTPGKEGCHFSPLQYLLNPCGAPS